MLWLLISRRCSSQTVNLHSNLCWTCFGASAPGGSGLCCWRFEIHAASIFRIETDAVLIGNPIYFNPTDRGNMLFQMSATHPTSTGHQHQETGSTPIVFLDPVLIPPTWEYPVIGEDFILSWPYSSECVMVVRLRPTVLNEIFRVFFHLLQVSV